MLIRNSKRFPIFSKFFSLNSNFKNLWFFAAEIKAFNEVLSSIEEMFGKFSMFFFSPGVPNIVVLAVRGLRRTVPLEINMAWGYFEVLEASWLEIFVSKNDPIFSVKPCSFPASLGLCFIPGFLKGYKFLIWNEQSYYFV